MDITIFFGIQRRSFLSDNHFFSAPSGKTLILSGNERSSLHISVHFCLETLKGKCLIEEFKNKVCFQNTLHFSFLSQPKKKSKYYLKI